MMSGIYLHDYLNKWSQVFSMTATEPFDEYKIKEY